MADFGYFQIGFPLFCLYGNLAPNNRFRFEGKSLQLFYNIYNHTWRNERQVEVPIFRFLLKEYSNSDVLEIGNVLSHYQKVSHKVIDKYEKAPNVLNVDICDYKDERPYDCIYSISTFEHIGFNRYEASDNHKVYEAIDHVMKMLKPGGVFIFSFIVGFNPVMDAMIREKKLNFERCYYYKRINGKWLNVDQSMFKYDYDKSSREVFIGIIKKS